MKQRLDYIDIAKGLAIILVVFSHSVYPEPMYYTAAFYVPVFFFCAGFTSAKKDIGLRENFWRHAVKLLKPYLFFNIILILCFHSFSLRAFLGVLYSRYSLYPLGTSSDICNLFVAGNYPLWFLTSMVVSYLLYYLIVYSPHRYHGYVIALYLVIAAMMDNLPILLPWSIDTAPLTAVFMYAGTAFRQHFPDSFNKKVPEPVVLLAIVVYLFLLPLCHDINLSVRMYGLSIIVYLFAAVTGSILLIALSRLLQNSYVGRSLQHIGQHSLTIFSIETAFLFWGEKLANHILGGLSSPQIVLFMTIFIQTTIAVAGGYVLSRLLHQNKRIEKIVF